MKTTSRSKDLGLIAGPSDPIDTSDDPFFDSSDAMFGSEAPIASFGDPKESYGEKLAKTLVSIRRTPPMKPGDWVRCSSLGYLCGRQELLASRFNFVRTEEQDLGDEMLFGIGNGFHKWIQSKSSGFLVGAWRCVAKLGPKSNQTPCGYRTDRKSEWNESPIVRVGKPTECPKCGTVGGRWRFKEHEYRDYDLRLTGHPDGFRRLGVRIEDDEVAEYKTKCSHLWKTMREPDAVHQFQGQGYLLLTGLDRIRFVYMNKDGSGNRAKGWLKEFVMGRNQIMMDQVKRLCIEIRDGLKGGSLSARACATSQCKQAQKCQLRGRCFSTQEGVL